MAFSAILLCDVAALMSSTISLELFNIFLIKRISPDAGYAFLSWEICQALNHGELE